MADLTQVIAGELQLPAKKVTSTVRLLDEGNTVPFIARYRKEVTGELDEVEIRRIEELLKTYRNLEQRREEVSRLISEQGKLTPAIETVLTAATKLAEIEDIYRPYRQKRKTRASVARERGLEPLATYLLSFPASGDPQQEGECYLSEEVSTVAEALQGAMDIVAEVIADEPETRRWVREYTRSHGDLTSRAKDSSAKSVYEGYYDYHEPISKMAPHRVLAINRGEHQEFLTVSVGIDQDVVQGWICDRFAKAGSVTTDLVRKVAVDAYKRLIAPAIDRELRNELTDRAEEQAVLVFSKNLRNLLLQPPVRGQVLLGIDPTYRTGCKWAVVDVTGKLLEVGVFYPTPPQQKVKEAAAVLVRLVEQYQITGIVIGNGTGSRETEQFVADFIKSSQRSGLAYTMVSEAGASVYSASPLAGKEFPELDVAERSAVSIARRLQDPLAELVKIEPKAVGVGQYQHDVAPKRLEESLTSVVESAVNYVGVDLNTASAPLLSYVAGISGTVAENIVHYREEIGRFNRRQQLLKVPRLGPKAFEQCAGFLRITGGDNPLDATPIHPESYPLTGRLLALLDPELQPGTPVLRHRLQGLRVEQVAQQLEAGVPTLRDIVESLQRPGRDPREDLPAPFFRTDVLSMEDLKPGMQLQGTVRNVVDFGAFVDIGVKTDGLVHISELSDHFIKHPLDLVAVGDLVTVTVLTVDSERHRVSLTMKGQGRGTA